MDITLNGVTVHVTIDGNTASGTDQANVTYDPSTNAWTLDTAGGGFNLQNGQTYNVAVSATAGLVTKHDISSDELVIQTTVPTITLEGDANGAPHPDPSSYAKKFSGKYANRIITGGVSSNTISQMDGWDSAHAVFASTFTIGRIQIIIPVVYWIVLTGVVAWVLLRTRVGNWVFAVGGDAAAPEGPSHPRPCPFRGGG